MFAYQYVWDKEEDDYTSIRIYGLDKHNKQVCIRMDNFIPFMYLELPDNKWKDYELQHICDRIDEVMKDPNERPIIKIAQQKQKLYYAHKIIGKDGQYTDKLFLVIMCFFRNYNHMKQFNYKFKYPLNTDLGKVKLISHFQKDASPTFQFWCSRKIMPVGWIRFKGQLVKDDDKITRCDKEYKVNFKQIWPCKEELDTPDLLIASMDIEAYSENPNKFPDASKPSDKVFQISIILSKGDYIAKFLLSLFDPDQDITGKDVEIRLFKTEADLIIGYRDFLLEFRPQVVTGYNIMKFDMKYLYDRAELNLVLSKFCDQDVYMGERNRLVGNGWNSSAYGIQRFDFLDTEGCLTIDMFPIIRREYKLSRYSLESVSNTLLGSSKDPLTHKDIFRCFEAGKQGSEEGRAAMGLVGKYCVKDSVLVIDLLKTTETILGLIEMAKTCKVNILDLFTRGQQIKVFSQIYNYCYNNNFLVQKDGYIPNPTDGYVGATVIDPVPGLYEDVLPFDFASLYPTTIIAYNIDYSTLVEDPNIPDNLCHVMEWIDCYGCEHDKTKHTTKIKDEDIMCKIHRKFRYFKKGKGVLPTILEDLLKARASVRKRMKSIKNNLKIAKDYGLITKYKLPEEIVNKCFELIGIDLEANQNISYLDHIPNLGEIISSDTHRDIIFKELKTALAYWKTLVDIKNNKLPNQEIIKLQNPKQVVKAKRLIVVLNKRQLSYKVSANSAYGIMGAKTGPLPFLPGAMCTTAKGRQSILYASKEIQSRFQGKLIYGDTDSCYLQFPKVGKDSRKLWKFGYEIEKELSSLFPPPMKLEFEEKIYRSFLIFCKKKYMATYCGEDGILNKDTYRRGVLTVRRDNSPYLRSLYAKITMDIINKRDKKNILNYIVESFIYLFHGNLPYTDFIITKSTRNIKEYKTIPPQVHLVERMRKRGVRVEDGERVEYLITKNRGRRARISDKCESPYYYLSHRDLIRIDYIYYIQSAVNPLDQALQVRFGLKDFVKKQVKLIIQKEKMTEEIKNLLYYSIINYE